MEVFKIPLATYNIAQEDPENVNIYTWYGVNFREKSC